MAFIFDSKKSSTSSTLDIVRNVQSTANDTIFTRTETFEWLCIYMYSTCTCSNLCSDVCVCLGNEQPCTIAWSCKGVLQGQIHLPCWQMMRQIIIVMMVVHSEYTKCYIDCGLTIITISSLNHCVIYV
jgi:hypothetical protein